MSDEYLPSRSMIPPGQALQPQNMLERAELLRDGRSAGIIAALLGITNAHQGSRNLQEAVQGGNPARAAASVGQVGLSALPFTGLARALTATIPRAAGTGLTMGGVAAAADGQFSSPAEAQGGRPAASPEVRQLQTDLTKTGDYRGRVDGVMGPDTLEAVQRRDARERTRLEAEGNSQRSAADTAKAQAEALRAAAEAKKTDLATEQERQRVRERNEGSARLQEMDRNTNPIIRALQQYGPYAGYAIGGYLGNKGANKLFQRGADRAEAAATKADDLMAAPIAGRGQAAVSERVGRVNQFWDDGQRTTQPVSPFSAVPNPRPGRPAYTPNPDAPSAGRLYQPTIGDRVAPPATVAGAGLAEAGLSEVMFAGPYRKEVAEAQAAVSKDPSEANIQRLEAARNKLAVAELAARLGLGTAGGAAISGAKNLVGFSRARPNTAPAEQMRGDLVRALTKPKPKPKPRNSAD